jgi:hypothetical protein
LTKISSDNSHSHPEALGENGRKFIYDWKKKLRLMQSNLKTNTV